MPGDTSPCLFDKHNEKDGWEAFVGMICAVALWGFLVPYCFVKLFKMYRSSRCARDVLASLVFRVVLLVVLIAAVKILKHLYQMCYLDNGAYVVVSVALFLLEPLVFSAFIQRSVSVMAQVTAAQLAMLNDPTKILKSRINPKMLVYGFVVKGVFSGLFVLLFHQITETASQRQNYQLYLFLAVSSVELVLIILYLFFANDLVKRILVLQDFLFKAQGRTETSDKLKQLATNIKVIGKLLVASFLAQMINALASFLVVMLVYDNKEDEVPHMLPTVYYIINDLFMLTAVAGVLWFFKDAVITPSRSSSRGDSGDTHVGRGGRHKKHRGENKNISLLHSDFSRASEITQSTIDTLGTSGTFNGSDGTRTLGNRSYKSDAGFLHVISKPSAQHSSMQHGLMSVL